MQKDRRRHERFEINIEVTFSADSLVCTNSVMNISLGGLCMECGKPVAERQDVTIVIPTKPPVKVKGKVVWVKKVRLSYLVGIRFAPLTPDQKRALTELIRSFFWDRQAWGG